MNEIKFTPAAYGWLVWVGDTSFTLNGDQEHVNAPIVLSSDRDGWKVKFKNTVLTVSCFGQVTHVHVG